MTSRNAIRTGLCALVIAGLAFQGGCKKEPPPPPPPPPPKELPPPPPPPVSFDLIAKELKVDPRVSVAPGVEVTDQPFARAAMQLADAIARGDSGKAGALLTRRAKSVLDELVSSGAWGASTKSIEAVRVLFAAPPLGGVDIDRAGAIAQLAKDNERAIAAFTRELELKGLANEDRQRRVAAFAEALAKAAEAAKFETTSEALAERPQMVLLLAVQDQTGAYLLGWGGVPSGQSWLFSNVSTMSALRPRAADFDGIGMLGFSLGTGQAGESGTPAGPGQPGQPGLPGRPGGPGAG
jgi:hypothetical protein